MNEQPKLLVVDEDQNQRKTLINMLRLKGYDCWETGSGAGAIAVADGGQISLVLMDLGLLDMPGLQLLERIKALSPLTKTIILTGNATHETVIKATNHGAFSYLNRPYQEEDLLQMIRLGIDRRQAQTKIRRFTEALSHAHEPFFVTDKQFRFEYVNAALPA